MDGNITAQPESSALTMAAILDAVSAEFLVSVSALRGPSRIASLARPRQAFCWLARSSGRWSYPKIGKFIGRDHSTVIHGALNAEIWMEKDDEYQKHIDRIRAKFPSLKLRKKLCRNCGHEVG